MISPVFAVVGSVDADVAELCVLLLCGELQRVACLGGGGVVGLTAKLGPRIDGLAIVVGDVRIPLVDSAGGDQIDNVDGFHVAKLREIVHETDPHAYITITEVADVFKKEKID